MTRMTARGIIIVAVYILYFHIKRITCEQTPLGNVQIFFDVFVLANSTPSNNLLMTEGDSVEVEVSIACSNCSDMGRRTLWLLPVVEHPNIARINNFSIVYLNR